MSGKRQRQKKKGTPQPARGDAHIKQVVHRVLKSNRELKYFDTTILTTNSTVTVGITNLSAVPQGVGQSMRVGDEMWLDHVEVRMNITTANADIFSIMRWLLLIWHPNTASVFPAGGNIFNSTTTQSVFSPLSHEFKPMYSVVGSDHIENNSGIATAPTVNSQVVHNLRIGLGQRHVQFGLGVTTASNHLLFTNYSNSAAAPFPVYTLVTRLWYYDERA
jgi:hypothetical protein